MPAFANRSLRSSRAGSPQLQMPYPQDLSGTGIVLPNFRPGGQLGLADARSESPYYPAALPPGSHAHTPYASTPAAKSPMVPQYHLPPGPYPLPAPPVPSSYPVGVPQYPMYPPYPYGYGQPYVFWGGSSPGVHSQNISQTHSPSTYPMQLGNPDANPISPPVVPSMAQQGGLPGALHLSPNSVEAGQSSQPSSEERARLRVLSFGSIEVASSVASDGAAGESDVLASSMLSSGGSGGAVRIGSGPVAAPPAEGTTDRYFPAFSVGLAPGDPGPSRKRSTPSTTPSLPSASSSAVASHAPEQNGQTSDVDALEAKVIDLTVKEPKWEFGTATHEEDEGDAADAAEFARLSARAVQQELPPDPQGPLPSAVPPADARLRLPPLEHLVDPTGLPPTPVPVSATALYASNTALPADEWKVRDYGYGGPPRGAAQPFQPRPRRGSYNGVEPFERGAYPVRRGRGFGRGFGRGRGAYGSEGGYGRARGGVPRAHYAAGIPGHAVPYDTTYYVVPPPMPSGPYVPPGYDMYPQFPTTYNAIPPPAVSPTTTPLLAPVPVPITRLSFPLDPTRYYLLGQLEYYLSEDNLAHDLYLRKNVSSSIL